MSKTKILLIGFGSSWSAIPRELNKLGELRFLDWTAFTETGHKELFKKVLLEESKKFLPDLTLIHIQYSGLLDAEIASKLSGFVVNYTMDVIDPLPSWFLEVGRGIDLTLMPNDEDVTTLWDNGAYAEVMLPGYDETVFNPDGPKEQYGDVVFLGNNYPKEIHNYPLTDFRIEMVKRMKKEFPKEFRLYGHGWEPNLSDGILVHRLQKEANCYRGCKIAISASHFERTRYTSDRVFRAMGCGAFVLAKWYPKIESDFEDRTHLRVWRTIDELSDLTEYYLDPKNDTERTNIAEAGQKLVSSRDTWVCRMKSILERIK